MSEDITAISDASFEAEVLQADTPVVVDFWAEWCNPCKALIPIVEAVSAEYAGKVKFVKCNIDDNPDVPQKYAVRAVPTLLLFKNGQLEATKVGAISKSQLIAFIDGNI